MTAETAKERSICDPFIKCPNSATIDNGGAVSPMSCKNRPKVCIMGKLPRYAPFDKRLAIATTIRHNDCSL